MNDLCKMLGEFNRHLLLDEPDKNLNKMLNAFLQRRKPDKRRLGVHVTDLLTPCFRRLILKVNESTLDDPPGPSQGQKMFDNGKMIHRWFQNEYFGPMGVLRGDWECSICGRIESGPMPTQPCTTLIQIGGLPFMCKSLGARWVYQEPRIDFILNGISITGNCDGEIVLPQGIKTILEIKSMREDLWKDTRRAPLKDVKQASIYAWAKGFKENLVVYVNKTDWRLKVYPKKIDLSAVTWIDEQTKILSMLIERKTTPMDAPIVCKNRDAVRAKRCGARNICFPTRRRKNE